MLDQNTDRMWYVIGAVIVGAAIIFLVNSSFPQLFASVGTTFEDKVEMVSDTINGSGNLLDYDVHTVTKNSRLDLTGTAVGNEGGFWYSIVGDIPVEENTAYRFTAPNGIAAPIITFYDASNNYLGRQEKLINIVDVLTVRAPKGATYAKISAGDRTYRPDDTVSPMRDWVFQRAGI